MTRSWDSTTADYVKYDFLRPCVMIAIENPPVDLGPKHLEVVGLKGFLKATAPDVDETLVDLRLQEVAYHIATGYHQASLGAGLEWLSIFDHQDACSMLREGLKDTMNNRENLRNSMRQNPKGMLVSI